MMSVERAAAELVRAVHAVALTGAGMSTESGIPDFRGPQGVWTRNPDAERAAYRGYEQFVADPKAWWEDRLRARSMLGDLDAYRPNAGHLALAELESLGILKSLMTQNVDALHEKAGSRNVLEYHGSYNKLRCVDCCARWPRTAIDLGQLERDGLLPPRCEHCGGIVKTDGVGFGEPIPRDVAEASLAEAQTCDVMLICGTSAVVYPFAGLPRIAKQRPGVTIIEINAEPTPITEEGVSDLLVQGKTGELLPQIVDDVKRLRGSGTA
ncbi:MAG: NAD-dependent deacetylase [Dehalococcoidia bacterium]